MSLKIKLFGGGNYFNLPPTRGIICWDKEQPWQNFSQWEMAWTSFDAPAAIIRLSNTGGANHEQKIHPTQKPVALYKWLLKNRAKQGDKILDTHMGSGSSIIACHDSGYEYMAFEWCPETPHDIYYIPAMKRINNHKAQIRMDIPVMRCEQVEMEVEK